MCDLLEHQFSFDLLLSTTQGSGMKGSLFSRDEAMKMAGGGPGGEGGEDDEDDDDEDDSESAVSGTMGQVTRVTTLSAACILV